MKIIVEADSSVSSRAILAVQREILRARTTLIDAEINSLIKVVHAKFLDRPTLGEYVEIKVVIEFFVRDEKDYESGTVCRVNWTTGAIEGRLRPRDAVMKMLQACLDEAHHHTRLVQQRIPMLPANIVRMVQA